MANKPSYFDIAYKQLGLVNNAPTPTKTVLTSNNTVPVNDKPVTNNVNNNNGAGGVYGAYASAVEQQMSILREQQALAERQRKAARREQGNAQSFEELVALAKKRGYKNPTGWAYFIMKGRR
jgi:hypothetical protein